MICWSIALGLSSMINMYLILSFRQQRTAKVCVNSVYEKLSCLLFSFQSSLILSALVFIVKWLSLFQRKTENYIARRPSRVAQSLITILCIHPPTILFPLKTVRRQFRQTLSVLDANNVLLDLADQGKCATLKRPTLTKQRFPTLTHQLTSTLT